MRGWGFCFFWCIAVLICSHTPLRSGNLDSHSHAAFVASALLSHVCVSFFLCVCVCAWQRYGFVTMQDFQEAANAVQTLNNADVFGYPIQVRG